MGYHTSLVFARLQDPSPGCSLTVALWARVPRINSAFQSTVKDRDQSTRFEISYFGHDISITLFTGLTNASIRYETLWLNEWKHIALAYQNITGTPECELYINFERVSAQCVSEAVATVFVPEAFMRSGHGGFTGFFVIDELLVFPEYLSALQIAQLKYSSD